MSTLPPLDTLCPVKKLYASIPSGRTGGEIHRSVVTRHIKRGILGPDGHKHKLRAWKFAGSWYTTLEDFEDFVRRTTLTSDEAPDNRPTYAQKCRQDEEDERELRAMGVL